MASKIKANNENIQGGVQQLIKNGDPNRKHLVKKQVFGEIKNVIHNQGNVTPLKQDSLSNKNPIKYLAPNVVPSKLIKSEQRDVNLQKMNKTLCLNDINDEINLLDYYDFRGQCCSMPFKSKYENGLHQGTLTPNSVESSADFSRFLKLIKKIDFFG